MSKKRSLRDEYWKHTALNLGQVARDLRYFYYHPEADKVAQEGSAKHYVASVGRRVRSLGNNIFYSVVPPHWHYTAEDLKSMTPVPAHKWFLHGYAPWQFPDPRKGKKRSASFTT